MGKEKKVRNIVYFDSVWDMHISRIYSWVHGWWKECPYSPYDFSQYFEEIRIHTPRDIARKVEWLPPIAGVLKVNVDGSSRGSPGPSGIGGVVRNHSKEFVGIFSEAVGMLWAYEAEVLAILKGLQFCKSHCLNHLLIESDSILAVGWVNNKSNRPWKLGNELNLIDNLRTELDVLEVAHIFREANPVADDLAKSGVERETPLSVLFQQC